MTTLFTIGYQGHAITTFCAILKAHGITMIVDVRERPFSRKPDFNKKRLSAHAAQVALRPDLGPVSREAALNACMGLFAPGEISRTRSAREREISTWKQWRIRLGGGYTTLVDATEIGGAMFDQLDLTVAVGKRDYRRRLPELQARLFDMEGWDAAGKGGAIQRLTAKLDPRSNTVHAIAAPTGDDKARHYLYRFWRRLPPRGAIAIFDRSWYGRVLVERVEGFARPDEWRRAYAEINAFERQLVDFGAIVCKFWLHISPEEQLKRFEQRQNVPYKAWKLTEEDWRNREKWPQHAAAANEMLFRTSPPTAPWTIVVAEDKRFGRITVLNTVVQRLESELGRVAW
jgi:polyphosphate kinase 2 (PPK2 family)